MHWSKERVARKRHRCIWCGGRIEVRERYLRASVIHDGSWQDQPWHLECQKAADQDCNDGGDAEFIAYSQERPKV